MAVAQNNLILAECLIEAGAGSLVAVVIALVSRFSVFDLVFCILYSILLYCSILFSAFCIRSCGGRSSSFSSAGVLLHKYVKNMYIATEENVVRNSKYLLT